MVRYFRHYLYTCYIAGWRFFVERYTYRASALSFTSLLALVPLLSVLVFFTSILPVFTTLNETAQNYIFTNFIPASSATIQFYLNNFVQKASSMPTLGIVFLFVTVVLLINTIVHTLNEVWRAPRKRKRSTWLIYYMILLTTPLFIGLSMAVSSYLFSLTWIKNSSLHVWMNIYFFGAISFLINTTLFSLLYIIIPNCRVRWRDGVIGGFTAALLFEIGKRGFAFYILHFPSYELIYGVMAAIPIFLIWIYISWMIVLFGALVAHTQHEFHLHGATHRHAL